MLRHDLIAAIEPDDYFGQYIADQGHIIGNLATQWFDAFLSKNKKSPGIDIDTLLEKGGITRDDPEKWLQTALTLTSQALQNPKTTAIYEATFHYKNFTTRADILAKLNESTWAMIEVKSTKEGAEKYIEDMAYTTSIIENSGLRVIKIGLMHLDNKYNVEIGDPLDLLKIDWSYQSSVRSIIGGWNANKIWSYVDSITQTESSPPAKFNLDCRDCRACRSPEEPPTSILNISHITQMPAQFDALLDAGIKTIEKIPSGFWNDTSAYQKNAAIVTNVTKQRRPYFSNNLRESLSTGFQQGSNWLAQTGPIIWPVFYLDFETISTAVPLFTGLGPYESVPIQFSVHLAYPQPTALPHLFSPVMSNLAYWDFIADPAQDQRIGLAEALLHAFYGTPGIPTNSTIFAYNASVEKKAIISLANLFPGNDPRHHNLYNLAYRLQDLLGIIRGSEESEKPRSYNFYHPNFHGKFGLKKVIHAIYGDQDPYELSKIKSGDEALAHYSRLSYAEKYPNPYWKVADFNKEEILHDLREYCKIDTYALVLLHYYLATIISQEKLGTTKGVSKDIKYRDVKTLCSECGQMVIPKSHALFCEGRKIAG